VKCFHCGTTEGHLIRLQIADMRKTVCIDCLYARHPRTALELAELILDKEVAEAKQLKDNLDAKVGN
jgi:hypothetical protein